MTLAYKERVVLISGYVDEFGHQYKKGQVGIIKNSINSEDQKVILLLDGYEESKQRAKKMKEENGEGPNVVEYLTEVPINILVKA